MTRLPSGRTEMGAYLLSHHLSPPGQLVGRTAVGMGSHAEGKRGALPVVACGKHRLLFAFLQGGAELKGQGAEEGLFLEMLQCD